MSLVLRGGRVIDPSQGINAEMDVAIADGAIDKISKGIDIGENIHEVDARGKYVAPGFIDLHGHWYEGSAFGIDADLCLHHGVTTVVDAGTTGFVNFNHFLSSQIAQSRIQTLAFLNISAVGIPTTLVGELEDLRLARPTETAATILDHPEILLGIKIRHGVPCGPNSEKAMNYAIEAAEIARRPLMVHIGLGSDTLSVLRRLRPGDILTHCFQGRGMPLIGKNGILEETIRARQEGVVFDIGHGCGSFSWDTAREAFEYFFYPDTISTDLHRLSVERPAISMANVMSKFLHLGMSLEEVILKSTWMPARVIGREDQLGTLKPGTVADICVFELEKGEFSLEDTHFKTEISHQRLKPVLVLKGGEPIVPLSSVSGWRPLNGCDEEVLRSLQESA